MEKQVYDVLILGGGPAGLTAAVYTSRAGLNTLVLAGNPPGGQLMWTTEVENFPGFPQGIMGPELIENLRKQAERFGTKIVDDNASKISGSFEENFTAVTEMNGDFIARTVILATGASAKWLNIESEQKLRGRGVSACATCDGFFFKNKVVAVVGGGDAAMEESTYLTKFASKVYVLVRGSEDKVRASKIMYDRAKSNEKIEFLFDTEIQEVLGEDKVSGLLVKDALTSQVREMPDVEGLFVSIGHEPNTKFLVNEDGSSQIELGKFGYALPHGERLTHTVKEGFFIAGDVSDHVYRQAVTAAAFGCMAAIDAERFLSEKSK